MADAGTFSDLRAAARRRLPRFVFDYVDGGSFDEVTLARNDQALRAIMPRQRVLCDGGSVDLATSLFDAPLAMPLVLAPIGMGGMLARRGEIQAVRAAQAHDVPFILSTMSVCSLEEVAQAASAPFWFQLYVAKDRGFVADLLARAQAAGCTKLVLTVDLPLPGPRYRDRRSGLAGPPGLAGVWKRWSQILSHPGWVLDVGLRGRPHGFGNVAPIMGKGAKLNDFLKWSAQNFDPSVQWRDLDFIRSHWKGAFIIKGITDVEDARRAADAGADGLIVSNHGGRQLDGAPGTAQLLPGIAQAVGERLTVLADGGVRSGLDVFRMLALGARGVLIGRPWAFALAAGGQAGVEAMLAQYAAELRLAMVFTGCERIADIGPDTLISL